MAQAELPDNPGDYTAWRMRRNRAWLIQQQVLRHTEGQGKGKGTCQRVISDRYMCRADECRGKKC
jgi:hypothetical protein